MCMQYRNVKPPHPRIEAYIQNARLYEVVGIQKFHLLLDFITALVEQ